MKRIMIVSGMCLILMVLCGCQSEEAKVIDAKILQIGTVTLERSALIEEIQGCIYHLEEKDRRTLKNLDVFESANNELKVLVCEEAINRLPEVILFNDNCMSLIEDAREKYDNLSSENKGKVSNYNVLDDAESRLKELKTQFKADELNKIFARFRSKEDEVKGITWFEHSQQPVYIDSRSYALPYMGCRNNQYWLRWKISYSGNDWVFWTKLTFAVDGQNYYQSYDYFEVARDNDGGKVWEYVDISVDKAEKILLEKIANSEKTIIRFEGKEHYYDLTVSAKDKKAIADMLTAYDLLVDN